MLSHLKGHPARSHRPQLSRPLLEPLETRRLLASTISGTVFSELDADGKRESGEAGLKGQVVYLDANFDGVRQFNERSQTTDAKGQYSFANIAAGIHRVSIVIPSGHRQTSPPAGFYDIPVTGFNNAVNRDFGLTTTAIVRGKVFNDQDGDGVRDLTEGGISGIRVFIDKDNDGKFDSNEKSRLTDINGDYRFRGLTPGKYVIRIEVPKGSTITLPSTGVQSLTLKSGMSRSNRDFGLD